MNRSRLWVVIGVVGYAALASSVVMAFLTGYRGQVGPQIADFFQSTYWGVQLAGVVLSVGGSIGMSKKLTDRAAVYLGAILIFGALLAGLFVGEEILNVHSRESAMLFPVLFFFLDGAILVVGGLS